MEQSGAWRGCVEVVAPGREVVPRGVALVFFLSAHTRQAQRLAVSHSYVSRRLVEHQDLAAFVDLDSVVRF